MTQRDKLSSGMSDKHSHGGGRNGSQDVDNFAVEGHMHIWKDHAKEVGFILSNFNIVNVYDKELPFAPSKEKIFELSRAAPVSSRPENNSSELFECCHICQVLMTDKELKANKIKNCEFCALPCCQDCLQAQRRFNNQMVIENAKDEPPRARCCKVCVRKLIMQQKYEMFFR